MPSNRRLLSVVHMAIAMATMFTSTQFTIFAGLNITLGK